MCGVAISKQRRTESDVLMLGMGLLFLYFVHLREVEGRSWCVVVRYMRRMEDEVGVCTASTHGDAMFGEQIVCQR